MYKDLDSKGGKLQPGPVWDLNLAYGNFDFASNPPLPTGWTWVKCQTHNMRPFWIYNIVQTDTIQNAIACRWQELRDGPLHTDSLMQFINKNLEIINEARIRNFQRWRVTGIYVWPNYFVGTSYDEDVNYLKNWLQARLSWMDENMLGSCYPVHAKNVQFNANRVSVFPNPFSENITFSFNSQPKEVRIEIYSLSGMLLRIVNFENQPIYRMYLGDLVPGIYIYRIISSVNISESGKIIKR
jgi:hypothetical protein